MSNSVEPSSAVGNSLRELFAAERLLTEAGAINQPRRAPRAGRGDVVAKRAADRRQQKARREQRRLKRMRG